MSDIQKMSFEEIMAQLEQLVNAMEHGEMPLEKLLENYEKGTVMLKECRRRLDSFHKKIEVLRKDDGNEGTWQDFSPENSRAINAIAEAEVKHDIPEKTDDDLPF